MCEVGPSGLFPSCGQRQAQDRGSLWGWRLVWASLSAPQVHLFTIHLFPSLTYSASPHCSQVLPGVSSCVCNPLLGFLCLSVSDCIPWNPPCRRGSVGKNIRIMHEDLGKPYDQGSDTARCCSLSPLQPHQLGVSLDLTSEQTMTTCKDSNETFPHTARLLKR